MIRLQPCGLQPVKHLLDHHPEVTWAHGAPTEGLVEWDQGGWKRRLYFDGSDCEVSGLIELADNNPMVCADAVSAPTALTTLALIAFGPLAKAGLIVEEPVLIASFDTEAPDLERELARAGLPFEPVVQGDPQDLGSVVAVTALAKIHTLPDPQAIDGLYDECFGRSFFVHEASEEWDTKLVAKTPSAVYRLRMTVGEPHTLLTIQVMADQDGKCGAAQVVHTLNVMCGLEEQTALA